MGSVIDYVPCPQCGHMMHRDYYYRTWEEYQFCQFCGKNSKRECIRNEKGEFILDEQGCAHYKSEDNPGYGCMYIAMKNRTGTLNCLLRPITEEDKAYFYDMLEKDAVDKEYCYLTQWNETEKKLEVLYGKLLEDDSPEGGEL